jgi:hypothetical protein
VAIKHTLYHHVGGEWGPVTSSRTICLESREVEGRPVHVRGGQEDTLECVFTCKQDGKVCTVHAHSVVLEGGVLRESVMDEEGNECYNDDVITDVDVFLHT